MDMPDVYWVHYKDESCVLEGVALEGQALMSKIYDSFLKQNFYYLFGNERKVKESIVVSAIPVKLEPQYLTESLPE